MLAGLGITVATATLVALAAGVRGFFAPAVAVYVLGVAEVTALTELLSLLHGVGRWQSSPASSSYSQLPRGGGTGGRPRPARPVFDLRGSPLVLTLGVVVGLAVAYEAFLVLTTPPNTWDSMAYHLPRAAEWYQRGAVEFLPDAHTERMNAFQPGAEIQVLYTFALARNDLLAELPQWLAQLAVLAAVYGIARRLGWTRPAAAFASLLTATLSIVALESVTTQNDLVVAALAAAAAFFVLGPTRADVALAGLALGLALGTKLTVALALPALALLALAAGGARRLAWAAAATGGALLLVGSYGYALNLIHTGSPLGDAAENTTLQPERTLGGTVSTVGRVGFGTSTSRLPPERRDPGGDRGCGLVDVRHARDPGEPGRVDAAGLLVRGQHGRGGGRVVLRAARLPAPRPALGRDARRLRPGAGRPRAGGARGRAAALRRRPRARLPLQPVDRPFMLTPAALTMPLAAAVYRFRGLATLLALVGAASLFVTHRRDAPDRRDGLPRSGTSDRASTIALRYPPMTETLRGVDLVIPTDATILALVGENDFVYPLYGPWLERRVHTVSGRELGRDRWTNALRLADERGAMDHRQQRG